MIVLYPLLLTILGILVVLAIVAFVIQTKHRERGHHHEA